MKKFMTLAAVAALVLSACAKIETETPVVDEPIAFGAYAGNALTKAGAYGEETTSTLQTNGFGVFAYQTTGDYNKTTSKPNFMYNTKVSTASWTYAPVKYWPNQLAEDGGTDSQTPKAHSEQADKVTFFAYAPHVAATAGTGAVTGTDEGIIALTTNDTAGDPKVTYKVSNDLNKQVDLLWAVSKGEAWPNVAGGNNTPTTGFPYYNLQKPAIGTAIKFYFRHALAQVKLQAVAAFDELTGGTAEDDVKVTIEQVKLTIPGMTDKMVLNLNNTTANEPLWEAAAGSTTADLVLTVATANIVDALKYQGAQVQTNAGVTTTAADVITTGKYFTVLPKAGSTAINVEITYYVTTPDNDLKGGYSQVKNVISHDVTFTGGLVAGTKNTIVMKLGLSEVKFDAVVEDWTNGATGNVDLPINS